MEKLFGGVLSKRSSLTKNLKNLGASQMAVPSYDGIIKSQTNMKKPLVGGAVGKKRMGITKSLFKGY